MPLNAPEYIFIKWENLNRETLGRIAGNSFEDSDLNPKFIDENKLEEFPSFWEIMF